MWNDISFLINKKKHIFKEHIEDAGLPKLIKLVINNTDPRLDSFVKYKDIKKDTLYIKVSDSILISELEPQKNNILKEINHKRTKPIKNIKFILS